MRALGAELTIVPSDGGQVTKEMTEAMIETARRISEKPDTYCTNQFHNVNQLAGYQALADEILTQTDGQVDAFVQSVGTGGSLRGISTGLRPLVPELKVIAIEPAESAVLSGGGSQGHTRSRGWVPDLFHRIGIQP